MNYKRTLTFLLLIAVSSIVNADDFTILSAVYSFLPDTELKESDNRQELSDIEISLWNFDAMAAFPLMGSVESDNILIGKASYSILGFGFNNDTLPQYQPDKLHELGFELSLKHRIDLSWSTVVSAKPNLATDFENVDETHVNLDAGIVFLRSSSLTTSYGVGARYSTDFGEPLILPILIYQNSGYNYSLKAVLPKMIEAKYVRDKLEFGLLAEVSGNHFRIGAVSAMVGGSSLSDGRIKYSLITVGPTISYGLTESAFLKLQGAVALKRRFELFDTDDNKIEPLDLRQSVSIAARIEFRK